MFSGRVCNASHFTPVFTKLGLCYTFNAGENETVLFAESTGTRSGLSLVINIHQSEYVSSDNFDAGVKVAVHPQTEPPLPDDIGKTFWTTQEETAKGSLRLHASTF